MRGCRVCIRMVLQRCLRPNVRFVRNAPRRGAHEVLSTPFCAGPALRAFVVRCRVLVLVCDACIVLLTGGGSGGGGGGGEAAVERSPSVQLPLPDPRADEGTVSGRRPPRSTPAAPPPATGVAAAETAADAAAAAAPPPPSPRGSREGGKGVDGGKGFEGPLASTELVCPACRLRR